MESAIPPDPTPASESDAATQKFSPSIMQGLLAAGAQSRPTHDWQPPSVEELQRLLPQYEISAFIARGGMGAVYKG